MNLSIVIPIYNESDDTIKELYARINATLFNQGHSYEILFIDDGSKNKILSFIKSIHFKDKNVKVLSFDRNYGQANACLAGFNFAKSDFIITLDADLQYLPEEIPLIIDKFKQGYNVVGGKRKNEKRRLFSLLLSFYFRVFFKIKMQDHFCSFSGVSRKVAQQILSNRSALCVRHLAYLFERDKIEIDVTYNKRAFGRSQYSLGKYILWGIKYLWLFSKRSQEGSGLPFKIASALL